MDPDHRTELLVEHLQHPRLLPDVSMSFDYGCLYRDLPPRRTLRERLRALLRRARRG